VNLKIAVTIWGNRISPVFDASGNLLVAEIENSVVVNKTFKTINPDTPETLVSLLNSLGVTVLICGAISQKASDTIVQSRIELISFVTGNTNRILEVFALTNGIEKAFMMPGCSTHYCRKRNIDTAIFSSGTTAF